MITEEEVSEQESNASDEDQEQLRTSVSQGRTSCKLTAETVEKAAKAIQELMRNPQADQRRAQFVASHSSTGSSSRPKKKCARKTFY